MTLWNAIAVSSAHGWPPGKAFEHLLLRAFELEGAEVRYPYAVRLPSGINEQIDGVIYAPGISALVESKDQGRINVEPVAKLRNQLQRRPATAIGVVFSAGGFTSAAIALAQHLSPQTILLWPGIEIEKPLKKHRMLEGLMLKYRMAVELGLSDFSLLE